MAAPHSVPGRNNIGAFDHQDDGALRRARSMLHLFGDNKPLPRLQLHGSTFQIDQQHTIKDEEELIDIVVFMPVVFTLDDSHPNDRIVNLAQRLIVPFIGARIGELLHINQLERLVQNVEVSLIGIFRGSLLRFHKHNLSTKTTNGSGGL